MKVSKNHEVCARCHLTGEASGHDCTIMSSGVSGAQNCIVAERTARKRASNVGAVNCWINMAGKLLLSDARVDASVALFTPHRAGKITQSVRRRRQFSPVTISR